MEEPYYIENLIGKFISDQKAIFKGSDKDFETLAQEKMPEIIISISNGIMDEVFKYCIDDKNDFKKWERKILKKIIVVRLKFRLEFLPDSQIAMVANGCDILQLKNYFNGYRSYKRSINPKT